MRIEHLWTIISCPSDYAKLDVAEKAILIAFIDTHIEQQNKAAKGG